MRVPGGTPCTAAATGHCRITLASSNLLACWWRQPTRHLASTCKLRGNRRPFISMHTTPCPPKVDGNLAVLRERAASSGRVHFADQHVEDAQAQQVVRLGTALHTKGGQKTGTFQGEGGLLFQGFSGCTNRAGNAPGGRPAVSVKFTRGGILTHWRPCRLTSRRRWTAVAAAHACSSLLRPYPGRCVLR